MAIDDAARGDATRLLTPDYLVGCVRSASSSCSGRGGECRRRGAGAEWLGHRHARRRVVRFTIQSRCVTRPCPSCGRPGGRQRPAGGRCWYSSTARARTRTRTSTTRCSPRSRASGRARRTCLPLRWRRLVLARSARRGVGSLRAERGDRAGVRRLGADPTGSRSAGSRWAASARSTSPPGSAALLRRAGPLGRVWITGGETAAGAFDDAEDFARNDVIGAARAGDPYRGIQCGLTSVPAIRSGSPTPIWLLRSAGTARSWRSTSGRGRTQGRIGAATGTAICGSMPARWGGPAGVSLCRRRVGGRWGGAVARWVALIGQRRERARGVSRVVHR